MLLAKLQTYEAVRLLVWLWPGLHAEDWNNKVCCGHLLAQATQKLLPTTSPPDAVERWAMIVAMMLNGTEKIYGDPDPFDSESGKSRQLQAWRLLVLMTFSFVPGQGRIVGNVGRIALNSIGLRMADSPDRNKTNASLDYDIVHYLNYEGHGNSIGWFKALDITSYAQALSERLSALLITWQECLALMTEKLPFTSLSVSHLTRHRLALVTIQNGIPKMLPAALRNVSELLQPLQDSMPANAEKQLGESARLAYQLKNAGETASPLPHHTKSELSGLLAAAVTALQIQL